jgi:hypothetical protein
MACQSEGKSAITPTLISDEQLLQSKGKNFFCDGTLCQLYQSFLVISQDPIREMGQNLQPFGSASVCKHKPQGFGYYLAQSLETKWGISKHNITKFIGYYGFMLTTNEFGTSLEDVL